MKPRYAIIVLGLGEAIPVYRFLVRKWQKKHDITPIIYKIDWKAKEPLDPKLDQLTALVNDLAQKGSVSLVGISAGASAALNVYLAAKKNHLPIRSYISICGRFNFNAHPWYPVSYGVLRSPRFYDSLQRIDTLLSQFKNQANTQITCFSAAFDEVVPLSASVLPGVTSIRIPFIFHTPAIYVLLSLQAHTLMRHL